MLSPGLPAASQGAPENWPVSTLTASPGPPPSPGPATTSERRGDESLDNARRPADSRCLHNVPHEGECEAGAETKWEFAPAAAQRPNTHRLGRLTSNWRVGITRSRSLEGRCRSEPPAEPSPSR